MGKLVSIIVPMYNSEKYISECIESLLKQTYDQVEIIIIDDGSTDKSSSICKKYAEEHSNIVLLAKEHAGAGAARMMGVKSASGEILMFVDSDDFIEKNAVSKIVHTFNESGADIVRFHGRYYPNGKLLEKIKVKGSFLQLPYEKAIKLLASTDKLSSMCFQAYKKKCFKNIHFSGTMTYCEDYVTNQKIYAKKRNLVVIKDVLYMYRKNNQSTTKTKEIRRLRDNINERIISCNEIMHFCNKNLSNKELAKTIIGAQIERIRPDLLKYFSVIKTEKELASCIEEVYRSRNFEEFINNISPDDVRRYLRTLNLIDKAMVGNTIKAIYNRNTEETMRGLKIHRRLVAIKEGVKKWM